MTTLLDRWVSPRWTDPAAADALADWYASVPSRPLRLDGFLRPGAWAELRAALAALPHWQHLHAVKTSDAPLAPIEDVPVSTFLGTPPRRRWGSQETADPVEIAAGRATCGDDDLDGVLSDWIRFVVDPDGFNAFVARIVRQPLQASKTLELARYRPGDYIAPHSDLHDGRILGVNCYLDPDWTAGCGGELGFENDRGDVHHTEPAPNTAALLPIREGCLHWVEPRAAPSVGRLTAAVSFWPV